MENRLEFRQSVRQPAFIIRQCGALTDCVGGKAQTPPLFAEVAGTFAAWGTYAIWNHSQTLMDLVWANPLAVLGHTGMAPHPNTQGDAQISWEKQFTFENSRALQRDRDPLPDTDAHGR